MCGSFVKLLFVLVANDENRFQCQHMKKLCIKLAILKHIACRNYKAKRNPLVIHLFYNYSRFYNIVFLKNKINYYNKGNLQ